MQNTKILCGLFLFVSVVHAELVELIKINPHFILDIRYATENNFTGKKVYPSARCFLQKEAAHALDKIQKELENQALGLKIWDAYRPLSVQKIFWKICPNENYVADPAKGSKHNRGCAVDVTLVDLKTGRELEMPSEFDDFSDKAQRNYDTMSTAVRKNCKLLQDTMEKYGFCGCPSEWWHFDFVGIGTEPGNEVWRHYTVSDFAIA